MTGLSPVTKHADAAQDNRAAGMVSGATRHERQASLAAKPGVRESLDIAAAAPMNQWITGLDTSNLRQFGFSGGSLRADMDDDQMNAWLRANTESFAHMADGCRIGLDEDAVVDPQLRVHGLDGLRVADISVLPAVPSGHPPAAVMAMAERACDLILGRALERLSSSTEAVNLV